MQRAALVLCLALGLSAPARASFPIGGIAIVNKVVFEPSDAEPERVQIWGVFALVKEGGGRTYEAPAAGYLYYAVPRGKEEACRKEWSDLKKLAGTGTVVGFGNYEAKIMGHVRKASETAAKPDAYPMGDGLIRFGAESEYPPVRSLFAFPTHVAPAEGDLYPPGKISLKTRNIADKEHAKAAYVFEFEAGGVKEVSKPIAAGEKETTWTPAREVKPGEKCIWRVRAVEGDWKGPVAEMRFLTKG
jgi:hypothetical protein